MIPGLIDTHAHYLAISSMDLDAQIEIDFGLTHEHALAFIKDFAAAQSIEDMPVISGIGYGPSCKPLASELDKAVSDRPAFLLDSGGHSGWMNTKMMELAGINASTPDPIPGVSYYARDEQGNPTGQVTETAVLDIQRKAGLAHPQILPTQLPAIVELLHSLGYVAAYDAGFIFLKEREVLEVLASLNPSFQFFTSFHYGGTEDTHEFLAEMIDLRNTYASSWLHPTTLKMFKDGTLEAETALMAEDYLPPAKGRGGEVVPNSKMLEMATLAAHEGFNVHVHAIGDEAISRTLDVYKTLGPIAGTKTIAHAQVLPEDGIERWARQSEVFYQTTPVWLASDTYTSQVLGNERLLREMPLQSMLDNGVKLTFGSDAPVSGGLIGMNPFTNIHFAVNRAFDNTAYVPPQSEGITIASSLDAYTINGAHQLGVASAMGSIAQGKRADFVVLDSDILNIEPAQIKDTTVEETWVSGSLVYRKQPSD